MKLKKYIYLFFVILLSCVSTRRCPPCEKIFELEWQKNKGYVQPPISVWKAVLNLPESCKITVMLELLDGLKVVEGEAVREGGYPGLFYMIHNVLLDVADSTVFISLVEEDNPVENLQGLFCLRVKKPQVFHRLKGRFQEDARIVPYRPIGCLGKKKTVAELVNIMDKDPKFLKYPDASYNGKNE